MQIKVLVITYKALDGIGSGYVMDYLISMVSSDRVGVLGFSSLNAASTGT